MEIKSNEMQCTIFMQLARIVFTRTQTQQFLTNVCTGLLAMTAGICVRSVTHLLSHNCKGKASPGNVIFLTQVCRYKRPTYLHTCMLTYLIRLRMLT